ncbi:MAG: VWA domain-containing protein [Pyrinomonadaceae bacterium]|nr:VWA domain-containing protein [Pyrinomonadaceae bacterium]
MTTSLGKFRFGLTLLALLVFAVAANAQSGRTRPTPTPEDTPERVETEEVKINILAYDENGNFFEDVRAEDLVITENDILHQPASLRRIPASVLIVMDTGGELRWVKSLDQTRKTAAALVAGLRPEDSVAIMQYSDKAEIVSEWTTDKGETLAAINRTKFGLRSAFLDAVRLGADLLTKEGVENRHLVLITDGTDSFRDPRSREKIFRDLLATDINVHVISYTRMEITDIEPRTKAVSKAPPRPALPPEIAQQLPNGARDIATAPKVGPTISLDRKHLDTMKRRKADLELAENQLLTLTENTNGTMIIPTTKEEMVEKTAAVVRIIDGGYVLTYQPKVSFAQKLGERNITVTSKRPGLVVEAKRKLIVKPER